MTPRRKAGKTGGDAPGRVWAEIAERLAEEIAGGRFAPGARLPSEHALADRFRVNRHTVRQALKSLASRGILRIEHGVGSFVGEFALEYALGRRTRFAENLARAGFKSKHLPLATGLREADEDVARRLKLKPGAPVVWLQTLGEARGRPVSLSEYHFPARRFAGVADAFVKTGSITRALAACGLTDYVRKWSSISAVMPEPRVAALLRQPSVRPVLLVESVNVDLHGRPVEFGRTRFAGDVVQLVVEPGRP